MRPQDTKVTKGPFFGGKMRKKMRLKAMESPIFGVISISVTGLVLLAIVFGWNHGVRHHNCGGFLEVFLEMVSAGTMGQIWYWLIFGGGWTKSTSWCEYIYIYIYLFIYYCYDYHYHYLLYYILKLQNPSISFFVFTAAAFNVEEDIGRFCLEDVRSWDWGLRFWIIVLVHLLPVITCWGADNKHHCLAAQRIQ